MTTQAGFESTFAQPAAKPSKSFSGSQIKAQPQTGRQPREVKIKSRERLYGRPSTKEEIMKEIVRLATGGMAINVIAETIGKHRSTVNDYLTEAAAKGLIEKTITGRVRVTETVKQQADFERLEMDAFVQKYELIKTWTADMNTRKHGKPIKASNMLLSHLKTICDTLELNPYAIVAGQDNQARKKAMETTLTNFSLAVQQGQVKYASKDRKETMGESGFRSYVMAVRDLGVFSGIALPKGVSGILSGKKVGYGKYSHVKLPFVKIDEAVQLLGKEYGYASMEQAAFIFYYLTCARNQAGALVKTGHYEKHPNGWITYTVYESKTDTPWTKYIPADNPHQKIFIDYLAKREGKPLLFIDDEIEARKHGRYLGETFEEIYSKMKISEEYFYSHSVHCLRHTGAHYWLDRTGYNHAVVCKIGGWKSINTLIDCYGQPPAEFIMRLLTGGQGFNANMTTIQAANMDAATPAAA